jgi:membrane-bound serine protease (ClpP class)
MKTRLAFLLSALASYTAVLPLGASQTEVRSASQKVYILPVRDDIMSPMVYLVRRGVKEAMEAKADLLLIDMDTNGGKVSSTEEIMEILGRFPEQTATYVNRKAFSAGSFIAVATRKIFMAPQSVIGAAAPILLTPGGTGVEEMPNTMEVKITSALSAMIRTSAEKNGHDPDVVMAMIDKSRELKKVKMVRGEDGKMTAVTTNLSERGQILTLTDVEAAQEYGDPPKPLLSAGTKQNIDAVLDALGFAHAERHEIRPTNMEKLASWLTAISPILLIIGVLGLYIEFKTPGFGLPGVIGLIAMALYFLGGYLAGFSGAEWVLVFFVGLALVVVELFVTPGTIFIGVAGAALMLIAVVMALMDIYPNPGPGPGLPTFPNLGEQLQMRATDLLIAIVGTAIGIWIVSRILPKTPIYRTLVSQSASGVLTESVLSEQQTARQGMEGIALSNLRPGGKAQFGDQIIDVISQGDLVPKGTRVRIIGARGSDALVEEMK